MKPMLACPAPREGMSFPQYVSPKVDGVRAVVHENRAKTRKLEIIPNAHVQGMLGHSVLEGLDGELTVGAPYAEDVFSRSQSGILTRIGTPAFEYHLFDIWSMPAGTPYEARLAALKSAMDTPLFKSHPNLKLLEQHLVHNASQLMELHAHYNELGYEGLITRDPKGVYKFGRSTEKQGIMMKVKTFSDGECVIIGCVEMMRNENELETNNVGGAKRSKKKEGMVPANLLGTFAVADLTTGIHFEIGSGFSLEERAQYWADFKNEPVPYSVIRNGEPTEYIKQPSGLTPVGRTASYMHFEKGVVIAPRHPTWKGFRNPSDIGDPT